MASIGRLVFETEGRVSGTSSVNFGGLFLGNPVTGTYSASSDCSMNFDLQDDSGGWQHFRGTLAPGGAHGEFHQTDPGTGGHGQLAKVPNSCDASLLKGTYSVTLNGQRTTTSADGQGHLAGNGSGTYDVGSDCFVEIDFGMRLRGIVVNGGRAVFAVQTDPLKIATATFTAQ